MANGPDTNSLLIALNRLGLGGRTGDTETQRQALADPRGFVKADLLSGATLAATQAPLRTRQELSAAIQINVETRKAATARRQAATQAAAGAPDNPQAMPPDGNAPAPQPPNLIAQIFREEATAHFQRALAAPCGFFERLAAFWANHFCVSALRSQVVRVYAGAYEREAIRPFVLGRFGDMLKAAEQHPAMLAFLDNATSIGPNSRAGMRRGRGLNENLAREILELHTLGVNGGYTQADVTSLARIITGWTFAGPAGQLARPGDFLFNPNTHEPGAHQLLGKSYAGTGLAQGEAALADIARKPATAHFIATKFARHFIADDPPPVLVAKLARVFRDTDGDLKALALALVDADETWSLPLTKIRSPWEFVVAAFRITGFDQRQPNRFFPPLQQLGQPYWSPAGPNGFADTNAVWGSGEGLKLRLEIAAGFGRRYANHFNPLDLLQTIGGDAISQETRRAVAGAESRQQGIALALMSPEFQRR